MSALMVLLSSEIANAQGMQLYPKSAIVWKAGPAALPKGVQSTILEGDPTKPGMFTMRLKFPAGTIVNPHFHTATEHATVIAGTLHIGMGDKFERAKTKPMPTGSFGFWAAGMHHYAWMEGEVILQLHGEGPWTATYVNPADDPRGKK